MKNYFIIHGAFGNSQENWFPWLEKTLKLTGGGQQVFNLDYPTPEGQNFENWAAILDTVKKHITNESVFICHSVAPIFLVKYCLKNNLKIGKFISVCGFNNYFGGHPQFDNINKFMFVDDLSNFIKLCPERICFYSLNDPYVKPEAAKDFAKSIKAEEKVYKKAGHFNHAAGYDTFDEILKFL